MDGTLLAWAVEAAMSNPTTAAVMGLLVGWMVIGYTAARAIEMVGIALRPIAKLIPGKSDDRALERGIWWADALADVLEYLAVLKLRKAWKRAQEVWEDRKKVLAYRRRD